MTAPEPTTFRRIGEIVSRARESFEKTRAGSVLLPSPDARYLDLIDLLAQALPYVEEAEKDPAYKPGVVAKLSTRIRNVIAEER